MLLPKSADPAIIRTPRASASRVVKNTKDIKTNAPGVRCRLEAAAAVGGTWEPAAVKLDIIVAEAEAEEIMGVRRRLRDVKAV